MVNPRSAGGQTGKKWAELSAKVGRALGTFGHGFTAGPLDAARLATAALKQGYRCIVAVGGDGTLNEVVNGFFEQGRVIDPEAAVGLIPRGTGGDFGRTFGWSSELDASLERLKTPESRPLDVGWLEFTTSEGARASRYFVNICSFGASGRVDQEVNKGTKALGGRVSFLIGSMRALSTYRDQTVRMSFDDGPMETSKVTTVAVANGRFFGGGMQIAPQADPCDGTFDVTVWSGFGLSDFIFKSTSIYSGTHVRLKGTTQRRCKVIAAESDEEVLLDVDGEQPGRLPCRMSVLPSAIRLKG